MRKKKKGMSFFDLMKGILLFLIIKEGHCNPNDTLGNTTRIQTSGVNVVNPKLKVFFVNCTRQIQKYTKRKKEEVKKRQV